MNTPEPELTFEQAALLARWLSGDREGILKSGQYDRELGKQGRWIWIRGTRIGYQEVWVPASLENERSRT